MYYCTLQWRYKLQDSEMSRFCSILLRTWRHTHWAQSGIDRTLTSASGSSSCHTGCTVSSGTIVWEWLWLPGFVLIRFGQLRWGCGLLTSTTFSVMGLWTTGWQSCSRCSGTRFVVFPSSVSHTWNWSCITYITAKVVVYMSTCHDDIIIIIALFVF